MLIYGRKFIRDERGATAIEYTLILALVTLGLITAIVNFEQSVSGLFNFISGEVTNTIK